MRILFLGEVVGIPTIKFIQKRLKEIREKFAVDLVVSNADGASDGYGILKNSAYQLHKAGVDIVTCGDFVFNKKDVKELLRMPFVLRPYNLPSVMGGKGYTVIDVKGVKVAVLNLLGRINFFKVFPTDPFHSVDKIIEKLDESIKVIILDFHGGTTSEVQAMQWHLAGKVTAVIGSHLKCLTADNRVLLSKTAVITGAGFCGIANSIGGLRADIEINKVKYGQFEYSKIDSEGPFVLQGALLDIDEESGNAVSIDIFNENYKD